MMQNIQQGIHMAEVHHGSKILGPLYCLNAHVAHINLNNSINFSITKIARKCSLIMDSHSLFTFSGLILISASAV